MQLHLQEHKIAEPQVAVLSTGSVQIHRFIFLEREVWICVTANASTSFSNCTQFSGGNRLPPPYWICCSLSTWDQVPRSCQRPSEPGCKANRKRKQTNIMGGLLEVAFPIKSARAWKGPQTTVLESADLRGQGRKWPLDDVSCLLGCDDVQERQHTIQIQQDHSAYNRQMSGKGGNKDPTVQVGLEKCGTFIFGGKPYYS